MTTVRQGRSWLFKLSLLVVSLGVTLLIFEVILRALQFSNPSIYETDPEVGWKHRPGAEGWFSDEGRSYIRINSDGLRDREHSKAKPPNTIRVAVLGDSMAQALQVPAENAFWSVVEKKMASCSAVAGKSVEAINFGVSGYSTALELHALRTKVWQYAPDIVLLAFTVGNDISDNSRELGGYLSPHYYLKHGQLLREDLFLQSRTYRIKSSWPWRALMVLSDHLRTVQLLLKAQVAVNLQRARAQSKHSDRFEWGLQDEIYSEPKDPLWREAWEVTERLIVMMRGEVEARGARFFLATVPVAIQADPRPAESEEFAKRIGIKDLSYPENRIVSLGERQHVDVLNLAPPMRRFAQEHSVYLYGFANTRMGVGHWNEEGHRVAGELMAQRLCESKSPGAPSPSPSSSR